MALADRSLAFYGTLAHSLSATEPLIVMSNALIVVQDGKILLLQQDVENKDLALKLVSDLGITSTSLKVMHEGEFLMPGLIDTHIHASQYINIGVGYHLTLLDWLNTYTFPTEAQFSDVEFASMCYKNVVKRTLRNGTTTASYFATIHVESSLILAKFMDQYGQRGYVGKVCMDQRSPPNYIESTESSINSTRAFIEIMKEKYGGGGLVEPCITPRFALSCTAALMAGLGALAAEYDLPIQTHMSENTSECELVKSECDVAEYVHCYEKANLLTRKTILAHCVYSEEAELSVVKNFDCGIAHCPNSNTSISSGAMDARKVQKHDIKLGLGTDISGGYSLSVLDSLRKSVEASKLLFLINHQHLDKKDSSNELARAGPITHHDAFYLATLGGAQVMSLHHKIGNFLIGKEFDALLINTRGTNSPYDTFGKITNEEMVAKFLCCGDDRNINEVYVAGRKIDLGA